MPVCNLAIVTNNIRRAHSMGHVLSTYRGTKLINTLIENRTIRYKCCSRYFVLLIISVYCTSCHILGE